MSDHYVLGVEASDTAAANAISQSLGLGDLVSNRSGLRDVRTCGIALSPLEARGLRDALLAAGIKTAGEKTDRSVARDARRISDNIATDNSISGRDDFTRPGQKIPGR